jgi:hypothetical protein
MRQNYAGVQLPQSPLLLRESGARRTDLQRIDHRFDYIVDRSLATGCKESFRAFTDEYEVDFTCAGVGKNVRPVWIRSNGTDARVESKLEPQVPLRCNLSAIVISDVRRYHCAKIDGIGLSRAQQRLFRQSDAGVPIETRARRHLGCRELEATVFLLRLCASASTASAASVTSIPMPSPGRTAILNSRGVVNVVISFGDWWWWGDGIGLSHPLVHVD